MISGDIYVWIKALLILMVLTIIYKVDNPFFRFVQSTVVGVSAGIIFSTGLTSLQSAAITPITTEGKIVLIIPVIIGFLLFARFYQPLYWLTRYPVAIMASVGLGIALRTLIEAQVIDQITATINNTFFTSDMYGNLINFTIFITVLSSLVYFFYTIEHKGYIGHIAKLGRVTMFAAFGYFAASATLTRMTRLIMQVQILLWDWLGIV